MLIIGLSIKLPNRGIEAGLILNRSMSWYGIKWSHLKNSINFGALLMILFMRIIVTRFKFKTIG